MKMFQHLKKYFISVSSKGGKTWNRGLASQITKESISYDDLNEFPLESKGFIRSSIFGSKIEVEKCSVADYIWSNVNGWWDKTAVVRTRLIIDVKAKKYITLFFFHLDLWHHWT